MALSCLIVYLTLTSVVFEFCQFKFNINMYINLTLTSVVFELSLYPNIRIKLKNLTLTSVVFECLQKSRQIS